MKRFFMVVMAFVIVPVGAMAYDVSQWEIGGYGGFHRMEKNNNFSNFDSSRAYVTYGGKVKYNFNETWAAQLDLEGGSNNFSGSANWALAHTQSNGVVIPANTNYNMKLNYSTFNWELGVSYNNDGILGGLFLRNTGFRSHVGLGFGGYNSSGDLKFDTDTVTVVDPGLFDFNLESNIGGKVFWGTEYFFSDEVSANLESKYIFGASPISNGFSMNGGLTYHFNM